MKYHKSDCIRWIRIAVLTLIAMLCVDQIHAEVVDITWDSSEYFGVSVDSVELSAKQDYQQSPSDTEPDVISYLLNVSVNIDVSNSTDVEPVSSRSALLASKETLPSDRGNPRPMWYLVSLSSNAATLSAADQDGKPIKRRGDRWPAHRWYEPFDYKPIPNSSGPTSGDIETHKVAVQLDLDPSRASPTAIGELRWHIRVLFAKSYIHIDIPFEVTEDWVELVPGVEIKIVDALSESDSYRYCIETKSEDFTGHLAPGELLPVQLLVAKALLDSQGKPISSSDYGEGFPQPGGTNMDTGQSQFGDVKTIRYTYAVDCYERQAVFALNNIPVPGYIATDPPENPEWMVFNTKNSGIGANRINGLRFDPQGNLWIAHGEPWSWSATEIGDGLSIFDGQSWTTYNTQNSGLPHDNVRVFAFHDSDIWIGTGSDHGPSGGIVKFDGVNWTVYNVANSGLPSDNVGWLEFDEEGNLWATFVRGRCAVAEFDGQQWTSHTEVTGNGGGLVFDSQGNVWLTIWPGGLAKYDGANWVHYTKTNSGLPTNYVLGLCPDQQDCLWIGTFGGLPGPDCGLVRFDGENWTVFNTENSNLPDNGMWEVIVDHAGNVWAALDHDRPTKLQKGLVRFDGNNWILFTEENSDLPDNWVRPLVFDRDDNLWIGTAYHGLAVYRKDGVIFPWTK